MTLKIIIIIICKICIKYINIQFTRNMFYFLKTIKYSITLSDTANKLIVIYAETLKLVNFLNLNKFVLLTKSYITNYAENQSKLCFITVYSFKYKTQNIIPMRIY